MTKISCKSFYSLMLLQVCALRNECNWGEFYIWMRKRPLRKLVQWRSYLARRKAHFLLKILPLLWSPMEVLVSPETRFEEDPWTVFYFRLFHILPTLFISYLFLCFLCLLYVQWIYLRKMDLSVKFVALLCTAVWGFTFLCPVIRISRTVNDFLVTARSHKCTKQSTLPNYRILL